MTGLPALDPEITDLGLALGLLTPSSGGGAPQLDSGWFSDPGAHLSGALADDSRREALVRFTDSVLGPGSSTTRPTLEHVHLFDLRQLAGDPTLPDLSVEVSLDSADPSFVEIGLAVSLRTTTPISTSTSVLVPLYRARRTTAPVAEPFALAAGAPVRLQTELTFSTAPPADDAFGLGGISLGVVTGLTPGGAPTSFTLGLTQLHLPHAGPAQDITVDGGAGLENTLLALVLGVVRQAAGTAAGEVGAVLGLLGLGAAGPVPPLPVDELVAHGVGALRDWFTGVMAVQAQRTAWLTELATVFGVGGLTGGQVVVPISTGAVPVTVQLGLAAAPGPSGHLVVTPSLGVVLSTAALSGVVLGAEVRADLLTIDTSTGALTAVPDVQVAVTAAGSAGPLVSTGELDVGSVRLGLEIREGRPRALVEAVGVDLHGQHHDVVDLSSPAAVVAAAADAATGLLGDLIDTLAGTAAGADIKGLLGLIPTGGTPALDGSRLLTDPLGALAGWWHDLLTGHPADVGAVLARLQALVAAPLQAAMQIQVPDPLHPETGPWSIPLTQGVALDVGVVDGQVVLEPNVSLRVDDLAGGCTVLSTELRVRLARFDLLGRHAQFPLAVTFSAGARGRGSTQARLTLGPVAVVADSVGIAASWSPTTPFSVGLAAPNLGVEIGAAVIPLVLPSVDASGHVAVPADAWNSVELLVGVLAASARSGWLDDLVELVGWQLSGRPRGPRLSLAALVADPAPALRAWLGDLAGSSDLVGTLMATIAHLISGSADGLAGVFTGTGTPDDPWVAALGGSAALPGLAVWMGPSGPVLAPSLAGPALTGWQPGQPGLGPDGLAGGLADEARAGADVADLAAGRPQLAAGLAGLVGRWVGTDGRVAPPATGIAGLTTVVRPELDWRQLAALDPAGVLGAPLPPVVVRVAVGAVADLPFPTAGAQVLDLTAVGLSPESFAVPAPQAGSWIVALAPRADCSLGATDPSGLIGQGARLTQVLQQLAAAGGIALVAYGGSVHPARLAADAVTAVSHLVTLGAPWSAATFDTARTGPSADALRLMAALLAADDESEPDDADLAHGRALVDGFMAAVRGQPGATELEATRPDTPVRAGLTAVAVFGVLTDAAVSRAMTAVFAAGLSARAQARAGVALAPPDRTYLGVRLPISLLTPPGGHGTTLTAAITLVLGSVSIADASVTVAPQLSLRFALADTDAWLVGGPGTTPIGGALPLELRRVSGEVVVGLAGSASRASISLGEGAALGAQWSRLVVDPPTTATGALDALPLLAEAQAVLGALTTRLAATTSPSPAAAFAALVQAAGITQAGGALVPDALGHLLHDPGAQLRTITAQPSSRSSLLAALTGLIPGASATGDTVSLVAGPLTAHVDTAAGTFDVSAHDAAGLLPWNLDAQVDGTGHVTLAAGLGDPDTDPFALRVLSGPVRAQLLRPAGQPPVALYPAPDVDGLCRLAVAAVPAEALRVLLEALRTIDTGVAAAIDALTDALGLLAPPDLRGRRAYRAPVLLFEDPVGWLRAGVLAGTAGSYPVDRIAALLDALKPFLGIAPGTPSGVWPITDGVQVSVTQGATGPTLALAVDATSWLPAPATIAAGVSLGLTLAGDSAPHPVVEIFLGVPDGPGGTSTPQHHSAAHLIVDGNQLRVLLRPASGSDLEIYPHPAGLGSLLTSGVVALLPTVLDELAAMTGDAVHTDLAALVTAIGRGLALASATAPAHFDATALSALAADPEGYLAAHLDALVTQAGAALDPVLRRALGLGTGQHVAVVSGGTLTVTVNGVVLTVHASPLSATITAGVTNLPVIDAATLSLGVDAQGLSAWSAELGPASLDVAGVVLHPLTRVDFARGPGWSAELGLGLDALPSTDADHRELAARWRQASGLDLVAGTGGTQDTSPAGVAVAAVDAVLELLGTWLLSDADVQALLGKAVGTGHVRTVLEGSLLATPAHPGDPPTLAGDPLGGWPDKLLTIATAFAACAPHVAVGPVTLGVVGAGGVLGVSLNLTQGVPLTGGDTALTLEVDASWIDGAPAPGVVLDLLQVTGTVVTPHPGIHVDGIGLRLGRADGPLIDAGVRLDTVAVHLFGSVEPGTAGPQLAGGVQLELGGLAVPLGGGGGDNAVAKGIMSDAGGSGAPPRPAFSPAVAVQSSGSGVEVSLRAGSGDGPWYLPIQRAFGPVYLEQVGLGVTYQQNRTPRQLDMISLYLSGNVSLLGLTASVQNLNFSYEVSRPFFDPGSWQVDVDGFAIAADFGPLSLSGGLAKFPLAAPLTGVEYLGMLKIVYAGFGIDMFGGYAHPTDASGAQFASFFAFGVLHAPLGGVPAFFITGVGIGFGINRELHTPTIDEVNTDPFMVALKATGPTPDPMQQLQDLRAKVPPHRGDYWIAAGISFTSFVLVTGEVLVTVQFGDGLEIAIIGLARAQLPTAELTLVSIELALLARFSEKEGLVLVQAQLTDNSWLLDRSVRLTGGFAFETWWKGPNAGQFVITVGGYHPRFHHDGYPQVPRVGLSWQPADEISVTGGVYFALCSEAIMAGAAIHAAAHLGPAHASLDLGGDGIVFFDPFYFVVEVYAEARIGITIWLLFGSVDIDISLGFDVTLEGPPFYLHGHFSVCGCEIPFEIGSQGSTATEGLSADAFAAKYLRGDAGAQVVQAAVLLGGLTAGRSDAPNSGGVAKPPDGSAALPFRVVPEFRLTVVTLAPAQTLTVTSAAGAHTVNVPSPGLGIAPMYAGLSSTLSIAVTSDTGQSFELDAVRLAARPAAAFPKGVWGVGQTKDAKTVPTGDTVPGSDGLTVDTTLPDSVFSGAVPIDYHQVELPLHGRKPLPFVTNRAANDARVAAAAQLKTAAEVLSAGTLDESTRYLRAAKVLAAGGTGLTTAASLRGDRSAPPSFGSLADDLVLTPDAVSPPVTLTPVDRTPPRPPRFAPRFRSVLGIPLALTLDRPGTTTVADTSGTVARDVPSLAGVRATTAGVSQLALQVVARSAQATRTTVGPVGVAPLTRLASGPVGAVANARPAPADAARLAALTATLTAPLSATPPPPGAAGPGATGAAAATTPSVLHEGELAVITVADPPLGDAPDTVTVTGGATRVLCLAPGARVLDDAVVGADGAPAAVTLPADTERVVVVALGTSAAMPGSAPGWYAGQDLPTVGWGAAVAGGVLVTAQGDAVRPSRDVADGGWVHAGDLATAARVVTTFTDPVAAIAVAVDDRSGADAAAELSMELLDAQRPVDAAGTALPPRALVDGVRTVLVYDVTTTGPNPRVSVRGSASGQLAGVLGSPSGADALAATVAALGFAAAVAQPLVGGPGTRQVTFAPGDVPAAGPLVKAGPR